MYSLNEQLGQAKSFDDQTRAAHNDHWRQAIYRSVSYDAVNTGTKGTVRSNAWKRYRDRKASLFADPVDSESSTMCLAVLPRRLFFPGPVGSIDSNGFSRDPKLIFNGFERKHMSCRPYHLAIDNIYWGCIWNEFHSFYFPSLRVFRDDWSVCAELKI